MRVVFVCGVVLFFACVSGFVCVVWSCGVCVVCSRGGEGFGDVGWGGCLGVVVCV